MSLPAVVDGRFRLASPATALILSAIVAFLLAASLALTVAAHRFSVSNVIPQFVIVTTFALAGAVVARHLPGNALGWIMLGGAAFFALNDAASLYTVLDYRQHGGTLPLGNVAVLLQPSWAPAILLIGLAILLFPDGRLPSARWRWPVVAVFVLGAAWLGGALAIAVHAIANHQVHVTTGGDLTEIDHPTGLAAWWGRTQTVFFAALAVSWLAWIGRQIQIYRHARGVRKVQLKWLLSGASICVACGIASALLGILLPSGAGNAVGQVLIVGIAALPIGLGVGILKYRLYEIDRLVSRTLSYAILTGLLVAVYLGLVTLITRTLPLSSPVAVAAATLAAAALFSPLRARVQHAVDRRFNRARYDAEATIAAFSASVRDAVDLGTVEGMRRHRRTRATPHSVSRTRTRPAGGSPAQTCEDRLEPFRTRRVHTRGRNVLVTRAGLNPAAVSRATRETARRPGRRRATTRCARCRDRPRPGDER